MSSFTLVLVFCVLLQILSKGQTVVIFIDDMTDDTKFNYNQVYTSFISTADSDYYGSVEMKVAQPSNWLQTKPNRINTVGYTGIKLTLSFEFTASGFFSVYFKQNASNDVNKQLIQEWDMANSGLNQKKTATLTLGDLAVNKENLGIYFEAAYKDTDNSKIYIYEMTIQGTKSPTSDPTSVPTISPTQLPTANPSQSATSTGPWTQEKLKSDCTQ